MEQPPLRDLLELVQVHESRSDELLPKQRSILK